MDALCSPVIERIHWVCNSPAPYNDFLFQKLFEQLPVPIKFYFTRPASPMGHEWQTLLGTGYPTRVYRRLLGIDWGLVSTVVFDTRSLFVTNCWQDPTSELIMLWLIL